MNSTLTGMGGARIIDFTRHFAQNVCNVFQIRPMLVEGFGKQRSLAFEYSMSWISIYNLFEPIARVRVGMPGKHGVRHISSCAPLPTVPKKTRLFTFRSS